VLLRGLPVLIEIGLLVFCLIQAIQTPSDEVRNLPKGLWILLIIFLPLIGSIAWLVAGRPNTRRHSRWAAGNGFPETQRPARPTAPDDDPEFLAQLRRVDEEHEEALRRWEQNLRDREEELRKDKPHEKGKDGDDAAPA
jgi:hypothetical protein